MIKEIKYQVKTAFEYTNGSDKVYAKEITLRAPTRAVLPEVAEIQGQLMRNGLEAQKLLPTGKRPEGEKAEGKMSGDMYISILSLGGDIGKVFNAFDSVLTYSREGMRFAFIDNKEPMTSYILARLTKEDYEGLLGAYIESFLSPSPAK